MIPAPGTPSAGMGHHPFLMLVGDGTAWICCRDCGDHGDPWEDVSEAVRDRRGPYPVQEAQAKVLLHQSGAPL
jgi:hypothetical protein